MATDMIPSVLKRTSVVVFWAVTLLVGAAFVPAFAQQTDLTKADALDVRRDAVVEAIDRVMPSVVNVEGSADVDPNSVDDRLMAEFFGWRLQQVQEAVVAGLPRVLCPLMVGRRCSIVRLHCVVQ